MEQHLVNTADGSATIYLPEMNEQYHSMNGAITESSYVYLEKGYSFHREENPVVLEIGFGTGLNCFLTAIKAEKLRRKTTYYTIEKYPLDKRIISQLNYTLQYKDDEADLFNRIHSCNWNELTAVTEYFSICKLHMDLVTDTIDIPGLCHIIYFDAFGPDKQPDMWTEEVLRKVADVTLPGAVITTYSAKGEIRRRLILLGFAMEKLPGPPGKKEMLRGIKSAPVI